MFFSKMSTHMRAHLRVYKCAQKRSPIHIRAKLKSRHGRWCAHVQTRNNMQVIILISKIFNFHEINLSNVCFIYLLNYYTETKRTKNKLTNMEILHIVDKQRSAYWAATIRTHDDYGNSAHATTQVKLSRFLGKA